MNYYFLSGFVLLLVFFASPGLVDPNSAGKGYFFYFFTCLSLLSIVLTRAKLRIDSVIYPLACLTAILIVSNFIAKNPNTGLIFIAALLASVGLFGVTRQVVLRDAFAVNWIMGAVALSTLLFALLGLYQFVTVVQSGFSSQMYIPYVLPGLGSLRINGPFGQSNFHALFMVVGMCAFGYSYLTAAKVYVSRLYSTMFAVPFSLLLLNFFLTQSRGGVLSLIVVVLAMLLWLQYNKRLGRPFPFTWRLPISFCAILFGTFVLAQFLLAHYSSPLVEPVAIVRLTSVWNRISIWAASIMIGFDHPLLGVGADNFRIYLHEYQVLAHDLFHFEYEDFLYTRWSHSELLQVFAEAGIFGLVSALGFVFLIIRQVLARLKFSDIRFEIIFIPLALLPFLVQSFFSWPFRFAPLAALFFILLALSLGEKCCHFHLSLESRWTRSVIVCCLLLMIAGGGWAFYWELRAGSLKANIQDPSQLEINFKQMQILADNPITASDVLTYGISPLINHAVRNDDVKMAQRLIPYQKKGIYLDGAYWQWYTLARLYLTAGNEIEARSAIEKTLVLNPIFEPGWGFRHYLDVLNVSRITGKSIDELLPSGQSVQEFLNARYISPPPQ